MPNCEDDLFYCKELSDDVKECLLLDKIYPGRIKIVRHEDIEMETEKIMLQIYKFLSKKVTSEQFKKFYKYYKNHNSKKQFSTK